MMAQTTAIGRRPACADVTSTRATESRRQQIKLGRISPARRRFHMLDGGEAALESGEQCRLGPALQHLAQERATGAERLAGELRGRLRQRHDLEVVGPAVTGGV